MISCTEELMNTVSNNLVTLSGCLLAQELISENNNSDFGNEHVPKQNRAANLLKLVRDKVKLDSHNYYIFIGIFEKNRLYYSEILRILNRTYHSKGNNIMINFFIIANSLLV